MNRDSLKRSAALALVALAGTSSLPGVPQAQQLGVALAPPITAAPSVVAARVGAAQGEEARLSEDARRIDDALAALTPRRESMRQRARTEARWLYHMLQGDALAARGGPEVLLDHAARVQRMRRVLEATLKSIEASGRHASMLNADRERVAGLLSAARAHRAQVESQRAAVEAPTGATPAAGGASVTVYGGAPAAGTGVETFATSSGRLLFPLAGRAEVRRAWREGADGPGVEITAAAGTPVRAVFPGRVAFADRYGAYGQIVIVDHGDHYYTVSANLGRIDVRVGQEMSPGDTVGAVGDEGRGPLLYFEVRRGSNTLDPVPWLGL